MTHRFAFITGMLRSGTTLLDKVLSSHPDAVLLSQPIPFVYLEAKERFLAAHGLRPDPYPLSDLFLDDRYTAGELDRFLDREPIPHGRVLELFEAMESYSGQKFRVSRERLAELPALRSSGSFAERVKELYSFLADAPAATMVGGKEVLCEEFLPHLLKSGFHGIVIVRDPRDVLASLNSGRGSHFGGKAKPTLFNLRSWRKSVAFALYLLDRPRFALLRYEDLVADPERVLARLAGELGITPFGEGHFASGIRDQEGRTWSGNSSFQASRGISSASVGRYRDHLDAATIRYVEAVCLPEMRWLGYPVSIDAEEAPDAIRVFQDPVTLERPELAGYLDTERAGEEARRLAKLAEEPDQSTASYFLFEDVHRRLREGPVAPRGGSQRS